MKLIVTSRDGRRGTIELRNGRLIADPPELSDLYKFQGAVWEPTHGRAQWKGPITEEFLLAFWWAHVRASRLSVRFEDPDLENKAQERLVQGPWFPPSQVAEPSSD